VHFLPKIRYLQIYVVDNAAIALLFLLVTAISLIMKLLMLYADRFAYHPAHKTLDQEPDCHDPGEVTTSVVGLIHAEAADEDNAAGVEKKLVKNLKWGARKNETRRIVLHPFSHLAETKASAEFTRALLQRTEERLSGAGYEVLQTPFGYFLDLDLQAPGRSTARIFTSF
jgi:hypothetical protein